jgi:hypothetical protein
MLLIDKPFFFYYEYTIVGASVEQMKANFLNP